MKQNFTRSQVVDVINTLTQCVDIMNDAMQNENTDYTPEKLLVIAEEQSDKLISFNDTDDVDEYFKIIEVDNIQVLVCKSNRESEEDDKNILTIDFTCYINGNKFSFKTDFDSDEKRDKAFQIVDEAMAFRLVKNFKELL